MAAQEAGMLALFGTGEPPAPLRRLAAGPLSALLGDCNLRAIRWGGLEVLRAIAFVVRDTRWGTYAPSVTELEVTESGDRFAVSYRAACDGPEGTFRYRAEIAGAADGTLRFAATGESPAGFATNRTGFVVLHPLDGVAGRPVRVEHASGGVSEAAFPLLVSPSQPVFDIRALSHSPRPGVTVTVRMEGDAFEMEDHRNWTDASFKTYVRPLARGFPYRIEAGERLAQAVALRVEGPPPPAAAAGPRRARVRLRAPAGTMPRLALFLPLAGREAALAAAPAVAKLARFDLVARADLRRPAWREELAAAEAVAAALGGALHLEAVIAGRDPAAELAPLAEAGLAPASLLVAPARDLKARPAETVPEGEAAPAAILAAARAAFPGVPLGGGMPTAFPELNRNRPPPGIDFVTHATQATVHAADDLSVMETLEALPDVFASCRAIAGGVPYRLVPATIGMPADYAAGAVAANPAGGRVPMAEEEPRHRRLFGAAFLLGLAARAAEAGIAMIAPAAPAGPFGLLAPDGGPTPLAAAAAGLAALAGATRLAAAVEGDGGLAALAAATEAGPVLWLANLGAEPVTVDLGGAFAVATLHDAAGPAGHPVPAAGLVLGAYALARLG